MPYSSSAVHVGKNAVIVRCGACMSSRKIQSQYLVSRVRAKPLLRGRLQELAVREPGELLQMLRLRRLARKGRLGGEQNQRREQADEMMGH